MNKKAMIPNASIVAGPKYIKRNANDPVTVATNLFLIRFL